MKECSSCVHTHTNKEENKIISNKSERERESEYSQDKQQTIVTHNYNGDPRHLLWCII